jgi:long-subunit fatty acid transport protein
VNTSVSLSDNSGSNGSAKTSIKPSLGAIVSAVYRSEYSISYFTFQQEMKSNLEAIATGDISDPPLTLINLGLESMIYYDPHTLRFGHTQKFDNIEFFMSLEYQLWDNYKAPTIRIANLGGSVRASRDFEQLQLKNIFVPKLGLKYSINEKMDIMAGLSYRQSPFDGDFSGAGNTVDSDVFMLSTGGTYALQLFGKDLKLGASLQYHKMTEQTITKTSGQEDGSAGLKIGSPGYNIGGNIIVASTGVQVSF